MKYKIDEKENGLDICFDDVKDIKEKLLKVFRACQEGLCPCPTEENKKLESLEIEHNEESIRLRLKSKHGTKINKTEINRCLEYTLGKLVR